MSNAKALRDSKLEELKRLKAKKTADTGEGSGASLGLPSNPMAFKPEALPEIKAVETERPQNRDFHSGKVKIEASRNPFAKDLPMLGTNSANVIDENQGNVNELTVKYLKKQLELLEIAENSLKKTTEALEDENKRLKTEKENFDLNMESLKINSEILLKNLENEAEKVAKKLKKYENFKGNANRVAVLKEIEELTDELDFFNLQSEEKEEEIERLKKEIQRADEESKNLQNSINDGMYLSQPEPPPPGYGSGLESHSQSSRRLLSDMGSTGAWNNKKKKTG